MTENPLYRRNYGRVDYPFQNWRPPSDYPRVNLNQNAAQDLRNLLGNFFAQNTAQDYSPQYQPPRYSDYYRTMPQVNYNPAAAQEARDAINDAIQNQVLQAMATAGATGGTAYGVVGAIKPHYPYLLASLGAMRYGAPIARGIEKFAASPVGKAVGKVADWLW